MAEHTIRVTLEDLLTGQTHEQLLEPGNYSLVCAWPCRLDSAQHHANGTSVITIKGRRADLIATSVVAEGEEVPDAH